MDRAQVFRGLLKNGGTLRTNEIEATDGESEAGL
jgi:hypothetical protein